MLDGKGKTAAVLAEDEPRHSHRRKMLQPKRAAEPEDQVDDGGMDGVQLAEQEPVLDADSPDIECLMDSGRDQFKDFNETDLFQGIILLMLLKQSFEVVVPVMHAGNNSFLYKVHSLSLRTIGPNFEPELNGATSHHLAGPNTL